MRIDIPNMISVASIAIIFLITLLLDLSIGLSRELLIFIFWNFVLFVSFYLLLTRGLSLSFYSLFILTMPFLSFSISVFSPDFIWYHLPALELYYNNFEAQKILIWIGIYGVVGFSLGCLWGAQNYPRL